PRRRSGRSSARVWTACGRPSDRSRIPSRKDGPVPLHLLRLQPDVPSLPRDVRLFLREADRRIERFRRARRIPDFVPSHFPTAFPGASAALLALGGADPLSGHWFCEWGSGLGVVACLAAMLGFEARGIEVEGELVDAARRLAGDFGLPVEFARGSFIPSG